MKILLINTFETQGGAAIAAKRLLVALNKTAKLEANLLVNESQTKSEHVYEVADTKLKKRIRKYRFILEKVFFMFYEVSEKERFAFSTGKLGTPVSRHPLVREADILHIHWINHSFLSYKQLGELMRLNKPVVITLHDMWYFTGGCHYSGECNRFMQACGDCKFLKHPHDTDLSSRGWKAKKAIYTNKITFVACSNWLADVAKTSSLLQGNRVLAIPNPIDTTVFRRKDKAASRKQFGLPENKTLLLYVAAKADDERKGYKYLSAALKKMFDSEAVIKKNLEIVVMGNVKDRSEIQFYFPTHFTESLSDPETIVACYNAVDLFVAPSLEDNLPNTLIESMACGTPVVAFNTGGIPDIIDHRLNGYLARYRDTDDLIHGIEWVIRQTEISGQCIAKVESAFSESIVAEKFIRLYEQLTAGS
ncbi:glycosyltransferase [Fluviicola sp.]|jgi:glycosyltransferase involved in cell wall biosynthesis|uniref:glycosyltransferase n=1 Tax=Fluviicola sp. TaxID=1917219 RepID=UPI00283816A4|nr:glycosyltransferase [Fluviicola sp.]MDR0801809.1 glycosyltransferase [Fluviicola sp.]